MKIKSNFCAKTGMNASVCVNMFVKAVLREQKLLFEVKPASENEKNPHRDVYLKTKSNGRK